MPRHQPTPHSGISALNQPHGSPTPHSGISSPLVRPEPPPPPRRPLAPMPEPSLAPAPMPEPLPAAPEAPKAADLQADAQAAAKKDAESPLKSMFERFEKALPSVRHYGLDHPEGHAKVRQVHRAIVDTLREVPNGIHFAVHPFCFSDGGQTVWEPGPPNDQVPYAMASSGVEDVRIAPGVTDEEIRTFLQIVVVDPQLGLLEGDIGAALWEAGLDHIVATVRDDMADADAREQIRFFAESEEVAADVKSELAKVVTMMAQTANPNLARADRAEAAAMALTTDTASFRAAERATSVLRLGQATATALGTQLSIDKDQWRERFYDIAPAALVDGAMREDLNILLAELDAHANRLARAGKWVELLEIHDTIIDRLDGHPERESYELTTEIITRTVFSWDRIRIAFGMLNDEEKRFFDEESEMRVRQSLAAAIPQLESDMVGSFMRLANEMPEGDLRELALLYVEHFIQGNQKVIIDMLDDLEPALSQRMLAAAAETLGPRAEEMLKPILMSRNQALRCEATALLAPSPEMLGKQLVRLLASSDPSLRSASLTTMLRYNVRHAGPGLVGVIEAQDFSGRPRTEQRQMLDTLYALNPPRAESLLSAMLSRHGMLADEAL
ncbi:MAG: hypothetical protein KC731_21450, partial [Myxococcales bacterium]|nr:hypothetical protein [Myxococcales bacterium]